MTIREIYDIWTREAILKRAFDTTAKMIKKDKELFKMAYTVLVENHDEDVKEVVKREQKIDKHTRRVRREVVEYLAANSAPDVGAALTLTAVVTSLERVGDYSEDMTKVAMRFPRKLKHPMYLKRFNGIRDELLKIFDLTEEAFVKSDEASASAAMRAYLSVKRTCNETYSFIEDEEEMSPRTVMVYTLLNRYMHRVGAHLYRVNSALVAPYHKMGSKKEIDL